jgi:hypothetical protein
LIKGGKRRRTIRWLIRKDFGNICQCGILVQKAEFMLVIPVKIPVIQVNDPLKFWMRVRADEISVAGIANQRVTHA